MQFLARCELQRRQWLGSRWHVRCFGGPQAGWTPCREPDVRVQQRHTAATRRDWFDMVKISFLIDSTKLPTGGSSVSTAVAVSHQTFLVNDNPHPNQNDPDYAVPVPSGESVRIYIQEANYASTVGLAPNGIIVHAFNGAPVSDAIMNDATKRPIDIPNFDLDLGPIPDFIGFVGDSPKWTQTPPSWSNWPNEPLIDQQLRAGWTPTFVPYITFNASKLVSGLLEYGVVFALTKDGANVQYFYFDPFLKIGSSS
ncbi:hypothetical protein JKA73_32465 [Myxococcus xanthus]|nr:hypothetical protein JKA73_32465 [Myxococcus xanthus]